MPIDTSFARRRKGPSPAFVLVIAITVVGLGVSFALPRLLLPRFADQPVMLVFQVHVTDDRGVAIPGANVSAGKRFARTDADGYANVRHIFRGKGIMGISGICALNGEMAVEAAGFQRWRARLSELIGPVYDYADKGTTVPCEVILHR